jgi:DNA primase
MFDFRAFCNDFNVPLSTHSPNSAYGWIQTRCPFCNDRSDHLGFSLRGGFFNCWRCGFHSNIRFIQVITGKSWNKSKYILQEYETDYSPVEKKKVKHAEKLSLDFASNLTPAQRKYLIGRNYNPDKLIQTWGIKGTGPTGPYKHRIVAPIYYNKVLVSYTCRDFRGLSDLRYKSCKLENEVIHHKDILYGLDKVKGKECILVEGVTDVWRLGPGAVACFGIEYKTSQLYLLAERFSKVFIMFDEGIQEWEQATKLGTGLALLGLRVEKCMINGDPGSLSKSKAKQYKRELLG